MRIESEIDVFGSLSLDAKAKFVARLMFELSTEARITYGQGAQPVKDPAGLRMANEFLNRISKFLVRLLNDHPDKMSDDAFLRLLLHHPNNKGVEEFMQGVYRKAVAAEEL